MLNPGMVIFDDFSTYTRKFSNKVLKNQIAQPVVVVNSHEPQEINYAFESKENFLVMDEVVMDQPGEDWTPELGWKWDLGWKILRPSLVLLWPLGPEDFATHPANPIDEILAIGGIIVGGGLMIWDFLD